MFALLLLAALGSTALVASAQTGARSEPPQPPNPPQALYGPGPQIAAQPVPAPPLPPGATYIVPHYSGPGFAFAGSPEESNLAHEANQLARQLGEAKSDADRDKLRTRLGEVLEKQFDQRQKRHEAEIKSLEAQVKKLRDLVEKRQENRREIIARRLDQILRESQGLGW
jgi:hypothetical protein